MQSTAPFSLLGGAAHFIFSALLPRSSSGQDAALSRLKQEFDSPTGRQYISKFLFSPIFFPSETEGGTIIPLWLSFAAPLAANLFCADFFTCGRGPSYAEEGALSR